MSSLRAPHWTLKVPTRRRLLAIRWGIMSEGQQNREPAEFLFVLDNAIVAAGKRDLQLRFVPTSGVVVEGQPQTAEVRSNVTIGEISLAIEAAQQE